MTKCSRRLYIRPGPLVGTQALIFAGGRDRTHMPPRLRHRSRASPLRTNTTHVHIHEVSRSVTSQHISQMLSHTPARAAPHTARCTAVQRRTHARARARHAGGEGAGASADAPAGRRVRARR